MSKKKNDYPRMNMAFYDDNLEFCRAMAEEEHLSITQFVNQLIAHEKRKYKPEDWKQQAREGTYDV